MKLEGKVALVTGAGSGIGRAIAVHFARAGAKVAVNDIAEASAVETLGAIEGRGVVAVADVADSAAVNEMFEQVTADLGGVSVLVNNAGIAELTPHELDKVSDVGQAQFSERMGGGPIESHLDVTMALSDDGWTRMLAVHLNGTFFCTRKALEHMSRNNAGSIINMSSIAGLAGIPGAAPYCTAKAGILGFTRALAQEVGSRGIRVNAICPGYVDTPMTAALSDFIKQIVISRTPLGRLGSSDEIAKAAVYLASDDASFVTGQYLSPNGGLFMA